MKWIINNLYKYLKARPIRYNRYVLRLKNEILNYDYRENAIYLFMDYIRSNRIKGDYLEFGVSEGNTFIAAYHFAKAMGKNLEKMRFVGFDSFEGLPEIKGIDKKGFEHFREGSYSFDYASLVKRLKSSGVRGDKIKIIKGWYSDTLNKKTLEEESLKKAAIIYVDCDLYESTLLVLDFVKSLIQEGTIIAFDEFYGFRGDPNRGEQKAFSNWLKKNKDIRAVELIKFGWGGNSFILRKKEKKTVI